ncbi:MAG TPA: PAS domain-containing sensor histidine kinase [Devosia sp.]|nr:PAS domain-containing sensor histidine kinase [Devosia sp.]
MDVAWITSPTARRILMHWADPRPAWLWSHDGTTLIWRNPTARYFHGRIKKSGLKLAPEAIPIKGQISRLIRLGAEGRSSLSRIQFLAGDKPISTTCSCTPLRLDDGEMAMLLAGVDPIDPELLDAPQDFPTDRMAETLFPAGSDYLLIDDGRIRGGSARALSHYAHDVEEHGLTDLPEGGDGEMELNGDRVHVTRLRGSPQDATLLVFTPPSPAILTIRADEGEDESEEKPVEPPTPEPEPLLPLGLEPIETPPAAAEPQGDEWVQPAPAAEPEHSLTSLFDRLADDAGLYTTLTVADETFHVPPAPDASGAESENARDAREPSPLPTETTTPEGAQEEPDMIAEIISYADDPEEALEEDFEDEQPIATQWQITGRGFTPLSETLPAEVPEIATVDAAPDNETAERVSRYNFEELGRILTDRVAGEPATEIEPPIAPPARPTVRSAGVVSLNAETLVLNRLPIGILLFRDQQVLFANRALVEIVGYESVESLRAAGIGAIFPSDPDAKAGPITHLKRRDESLLPVNARLQSVTWQGRPALMLSASVAEPQLGHEIAVRAFAEIAADAREEGFIAADRNGIITDISGHGRVLLGTPESDLEGKPLSTILAPGEIDDLRRFLERPARFAETARPSLVADCTIEGVEVALFAEGQAGIVSGYFGFLRRRAIAQALAPSDELEPSMLGRLSRGIRRPLNTIIGFADLIRSAAFGAIENERYVEYARDIKTAGNEIAVLVDELDDFARLKDGRYAPRPSDVDLGGLLESCMARVKGQASAARVLIRSAISERLPRIRADRASLGQAVLNLMASAIDQTPPGGSVVLSAQWQDDGGIAVHVRDSAEHIVDMGERFVVFRDGHGKDGEELTPVRSSVGLALTRSLLAVNACSLSVDPTVGVGTLFSLVIPAELVVQG